MKTSYVVGLCVCVLLWPLLAGAASPPSAGQVLVKLGQASGGSGWNKIAAVALQAKITENGMQCSVHDVVDVRNGSARMHTQCPVYSTASGIDAQSAWNQDFSGQIHPLDSPEANTLTVTDRWLNQRGPFLPYHWPAELKMLTPVTIGGVTYERVAATPAGGRAVTLWIDSADERLAQTVMRRAFQTVSVHYDDYRDVHGVWLPFRITTDTGTPVQVTTETVTHYTLLASVPARSLQRPSGAVTDATLPGGETQLPLLKNVAGFVMLDARINGKGPFPFVLDSGGRAILTPAAAKALGLKTMGRILVQGAGAGGTSASFTRVESVQLGAATLRNQVFMIMPLSPIVTDRGDKPAVAGVLGLEVFERFAVTIDSADHRLILRAFKSATPPAGAIALSIRFTSSTPLVDATLDGKPGIFQIDTGNPAPLMIFPGWAAHMGLAPYYLAGLPAQSGGGVGKSFTTHAAYIHSLRLGGRRVPGPLLGVLTPHGVNEVSNPSDAGNLGMTVWHAFRVTLNYRKGQIYLTPRADYAPPRIIATAGFAAIKLSHGAFTVVHVAAHGAAAKAGLKPGEQIVAVDGVQAKALPSLYLMRYIAHSKPGTRLDLSLAGGHQLALVLRSDAAQEKALHPSVG